MTESAATSAPDWAGRAQRPTGTSPGAGGSASPSPDGRVEVRIVAADPDAARQVAQVLSRALVCDEPRSYPADGEAGGTRLHLTVDTLRTRTPTPTPRTWLADSHSQARRTHPDETG